MRFASCLILFLAAACGSSGKSSPDLSAADLAMPMIDFAISGCPSLSSYCSSTSNCPASAGDAEGAYCASDGGVSTQPGISVATAGCPTYERVAIAFAATNNSYDYYFDASSGALAAVVVTEYQGIPSCLGGPTSFTLPVCQPLVTLCD